MGARAVTDGRRLPPNPHPVADLDAVRRRPAARNLQHHPARTADARLEGERARPGDDPGHAPGGVDEDQVEGNQGVLHPEGVLRLLVEEEEHPVSVGELLAEHEPLLAFCGGVGQLHPHHQRLPPRLEDGPRTPGGGAGRRGPHRDGDRQDGQESAGNVPLSTVKSRRMADDG